MKYNYLFLFLLGTFSVLAQQTYTLKIPADRFQIDEEHHIVLCNIALDTIADFSSYEQVQLELNETYFFNTKPEAITTTTTYQVTKDTTNYALYFSKFPVIALNAPQTIIDDPKRFASFVYADNNEVKKSNVGVELRGGFSQTLPKKTYDLEFWEDEAGEDNKDMQFGNLREDDDWILDALYNEPLRLRAYTSHKLWLDMHTLYYQEEEDEAKAGADVMYVELFLNGTYNGIYMLSEQVDKKQLQLKSFKEDNIRGELYKAEQRTATSRFQSSIPIDNSKDVWGGFELKLPDADDVIDWSNLKDFTEFVAYSNYNQFHEQLENRVQLDNAVDYFIFLNLVGAADNRGKNFYLARYTEGEPYFFVPWDLDGAFGLRWDGTYINGAEFLLSDGLFDRLFVKQPKRSVFNKLYARYQELRATVLSEDRLAEALTSNYNLLKENKIYEREALIWPNYPFDDASASYNTNWLSQRLSFLDTYFADLNLGAEDVMANPKFSVYPNPATTQITITRPTAKTSVYTIYNINGKMLQEGTIAKVKETIALQNFTAGVYLLQIDEAISKIIVQ